MMRQSSSFHIKINRHRIHFLKFILEAYDGLGILSVVDAKAGIVVIRFSLECGPEVVELICSLNAKGQL